MKMVRKPYPVRSRAMMPDFINFFAIVLTLVILWFIAFTYFNPPAPPKHSLSDVDKGAVNRMMIELNEESEAEDWASSLQACTQTHGCQVAVASIKPRKGTR